MKINNEILYSFLSCQYKAYIKAKNQKGVTSEYQIYINQLKQKQRINFDKNILKNKLQIYTDCAFDKAIKRNGFAFDLKFENPNIDIILDGIEFLDDKNIVPILFSPFEAVTKIDKLYISLQALLIQRELNIKLESCIVLYGKNSKRSKFQLSSNIKSLNKLLDELALLISISSEPFLILNNHCTICEYNDFCREKAISDGNMSLLDRATKKSYRKI